MHNECMANTATSIQDLIYAALRSAAIMPNDAIIIHDPDGGLAWYMPADEYPATGSIGADADAYGDRTNPAGRDDYVNNISRTLAALTAAGYQTIEAA